MFAQMKDPGPHIDLLLTKPRRLDTLMKILGESEIVSDYLIGIPHLVEWLTQPELLLEAHNLQLLEEVLRTAAPKTPADA